MISISWWVRLPSRLLKDEQELRKLYEQEPTVIISHRWIRSADGEPSVLVRIGVLSLELDLEVRFPANYPDGCPSVRPVPHTIRVSGHQYVKSGILCLEIGPDNWHPNYTVANLVRSAWNLFALETIRELDPTDPLDIPSRHVSGLAERIARSRGVFLRTPQFDERLRDAPALQEFEVFLIAGPSLRLIPAAIPKGEDLAIAAGLKEGERYPSLVIQLNDETMKDVPDDPQEFRDFIKPFVVSVDIDKFVVFFLRWPDNETRGYLFFKSALVPLTDMPLLQDGVRTPDVLRSRLAGLKIGVVGLGSLGSKVAESLARTGVRHFVVVDGDVMKAENVCRHAASFRAIGLMKVDAAEQLLREVSSEGMIVEKHSLNLGAATQPEVHARVIEALAGCDVLVDATANPEAFLHIAGLASDHRRPLVWGEVFAGGLGGLVASAHPSHTSCPRCVRMAFQATASTWPPSPHQTTPAGLYGTGDDSPVVATDADVSYVAAAIARRVLDIVRDQPLLSAVVMLGIQRDWIFETPMQNIPVHIRADDCSCERCWTPPEASTPEAEAAAAELFKNHEHAHDSSAA